MSQTVIINGVTYSQPDQGTNPPWGDVQAAVIVALAASVMSGRSIDAASNTIRNIGNTEIKSAAGISVNKLAALTPSTAIVTDSSGFLLSSAATATEVGYLSGVTSAIQTQIGLKLTNPLTTTGDLVTLSGGVPTRVGIGSTNQVLTVVGGLPAWVAPSVGGDVKGPTTSTDTSIAVFDGTNNKTIKGTGVLIGSGNVMTLPAAVNFKRTATAISYASAAETIIAVTSTAAARTITLSNTDKISGRVITVVDESGGASVNAITITPQSGTISGMASLTINVSYGWLSVESDGSNWFLIGGNGMSNSVFKKIAASAGTNGTNVKASPGTVYAIICSSFGLNTGGFLKLYNSAGTPSVGTDVPLLTVPSAAGTASANNGAPTCISFPNGITFSTGIAIATTNLMTDGDSTNLSNPMAITIVYA